MKRIILYILLSLILCRVYANQLIHSYYGDYHDVVRIVFVIDEEPFYNTLMDTDNKTIYINISETKLDQHILPLDFTEYSLVNQVKTEKLQNDIKITILTNEIYYADTFYLNENQFKIVIDIYKAKDPQNLEMANNYVYFFQSVGFLDRANELQKRIDNNEFLPQSSPVITPHKANTPIQNINDPIQEKNEPNTHLVNNTLQDIPKDPLLYIKPDISKLNANQNLWISNAFRVYEIFKEIDDLLKKAKASLTAYDKAKTVDISFIETMSSLFNNMSDSSIRLNQIKLELNSLSQNSIVSDNSAIIYTKQMINDITKIIPDYIKKVESLQSEYRNRISQ